MFPNPAWWISPGRGVRRGRWGIRARAAVQTPGWSSTPPSPGLDAGRPGARSSRPPSTKPARSPTPPGPPPPLLRRAPPAGRGEKRGRRAPPPALERAAQQLSAGAAAAGRRDSGQEDARRAATHRPRWALRPAPAGESSGTHGEDSSGYGRCPRRDTGLHWLKL